LKPVLKRFSKNWKRMTSNDEEALKTNRPKTVYFWNNIEVMKWLKRHCSEYHDLYAPLFQENQITGRSLVRLNSESLSRMGISNPDHRDELCRSILKLKLKSDILDLKDMEKRNGDLTAASTMTIGMS